MDRLTVRVQNDYVPKEFDLVLLSHLDRNLKEIINKLGQYEDTGFEPHEIKKLHKSCSLDVGQTVYIITRGGWMHEVIECTITRKTVRTRNTFSVEGNYANGSYYNGTFSEKSLGKKVFLNKEDAIEACEKLNSKARR